ncbi:hypothetical protein KPL42_07265 [Clostridium gasigenes]|uniref:hypothetical protein n=1 Tax=Clostridium gasigenes TaxID=94869 RepID=UPI001C0C7DCC|nr:hypothetical protein [Clostridium gasigenes]MBU3088289.1 hypothetical protein [Clostridium gasigenes]
MENNNLENKVSMKNEYEISHTYKLKKSTMKKLYKIKANEDDFNIKFNAILDSAIVCCSYVLKYNAAISLLEEITPNLIIEVKVKRAKLILEKYKELTPRNGRYTDELLEKKMIFYNEFISIK